MIVAYTFQTPFAETPTEINDTWPGLETAWRMNPAADGLYPIRTNYHAFDWVQHPQTTPIPETTFARELVAVVGHCKGVEHYKTCVEHGRGRESFALRRGDIVMISTPRDGRLWFVAAFAQDMPGQHETVNIRTLLGLYQVMPPENAAEIKEYIS